jgi:hypothetical protein
MEESLENYPRSEDSDQEIYDKAEAEVIEYCSIKPVNRLAQSV